MGFIHRHPPLHDMSGIETDRDTTRANTKEAGEVLSRFHICSRCRTMMAGCRGTEKIYEKHLCWSERTVTVSTGQIPAHLCEPHDKQTSKHMHTPTRSQQGINTLRLDINTSPASHRLPAKTKPQTQAHTCKHTPSKQSWPV